MIWNSSRTIRPGSSGGASKAGPVSGSGFWNSRIPNCHGEWQSSRKSDHRPTGCKEEQQLDIISTTHRRKLWKFAVFLAQFDWLLFLFFFFPLICFLFIVISHVKVYQAHPAEVFHYSHMVTGWKFQQRSNVCWEALRLYLLYSSLSECDGNL